MFKNYSNGVSTTPSSCSLNDILSSSALVTPVAETDRYGNIIGLQWAESSKFNLILTSDSKLPIASDALVLRTSGEVPSGDYDGKYSAAYNIADSRCWLFSNDAWNEQDEILVSNKGEDLEVFSKEGCSTKASILTFRGSIIHECVQDGNNVCIAIDDNLSDRLKQGTYTIVVSREFEGVTTVVRSISVSILMSGANTASTTSLLEPDTRSITQHSLAGLSLKGFHSAESGQFPYKSANGVLSWREIHEYDDREIRSAIQENTNKLRGFAPEQIVKEYIDEISLEANNSDDEIRRNLENVRITADRNTSEINKLSSTIHNTTEQLNNRLESSMSTVIPLYQKGSAGGVATLDDNGRVPSSQLPSYVDDIIEGKMTDSGEFYKYIDYSGDYEEGDPDVVGSIKYIYEDTPTAGETGKIYVDILTNKSYRYSGHGYDTGSFVVIPDSIALGETSSTAFRGDYGRSAYIHSMLQSGNPHNVSKDDIGLGNVENKSSAAILSELTGDQIISKFDSTSFIKLGEGKNSISLNDGEAIGHYSIAENKGTLSGCLGYYIDSIYIIKDKDGNTTGGEVYLSSSESPVIPKRLTSTQEVDSSFEQTYILKSDEDTYLSVESDGYFHWPHAAKITAIENNKITYEGVIEPANLWELGESNNGSTQRPFVLFIANQPKAGKIVVGTHTHAEGLNTFAAANQSHAEGYYTQAIGRYSHSEGAMTVAGYGAHAEGLYSIALGLHSHSEGYTNESIGKDSHSEGRSTKAYGEQAHTEGYHTIASGNFGSHAEGNSTKATNNGAHSEGRVTEASGKYSHAEGEGTKATESNAHAEGYNTSASGKSSHAEGDSTCASARGSHAEGVSTEALLQAAHSEGLNTKASGERSHAEGYSTIASGRSSHAEGNGTYASGENSHAEGDSTIASEVNAHAEGRGTTASADASHAEGHSTEASGKNSHAEGGRYDSNGTTVLSDRNVDDITVYGTTASGLQSHAEGTQTYAPGFSSHAEGFQTNATKGHTHAEGYQTTASGTSAHAEGRTTVASGLGSHAEGRLSVASGVGSHAEGYNTAASGENSHAEGFNAVASGNIGSHAEGNNTKATNNGAHAEGRATEASGKYSHAEGEETKATDGSAHAEGRATEASGDGAHAEGSNKTSTGGNRASYTNNGEVLDHTHAAAIGSHAEGVLTKAAGYTAHSEGLYTLAKGNSSHAEGDSTYANGRAAHAEGIKTMATVQGSHAEGIGTIATGEFQHVQGKYNAIDKYGKSGNYAHIVGWGTEASRKNIHTLDTNGNAWFRGTLKVSGDNYSSGDSKSVLLEGDAIAPPAIAEVGQTIVVKEVDSSGKPTAWEAVDLLPKFTSNDEGKILKIVNGSLAWVSLINAEEVAL